MPRLHKDLPANRREWSFGDLVYWHLFVFGTRPGIDPAATAGREWDMAAICPLLGITDRTLRNWVFDKHLPDSTGALAHELFGDNPRWDIARLELIEALKKTRARKRKKGFVGALVSLVRPVEEERVAETAQAGDTSEPAAQEARELAANGSHLGAPKPQRSRLRSILPFVGRRAAEKSKGALRTDPISPWYTFKWERARPRPRRTKALSILLPGLAFSIGVGIWAFRTPEAPPKQKTVAVVTPVPEPKEKPAPVAPAIDASNEKSRRPPAVPPAATPETKVPDPAQAEAARKAAEAERIARLAFAANQAAYDKKMRDEETAARRRDQDGDAEKELQATRAWNARQVAGIGYDLMENTSISGTSGGLIYVENVVDCALKCSEIACDAFAFSSLGTNRHGCYRYRGPVNLVPHEAYSVGKRMPSTILTRQVADRGAPLADAAPVVGDSTAQTDPPPAPRLATAQAAPADDLTRCANGPFKVSGFKLLCDKLIAGGGSPGSYRERYVVPNINVCAAYCRQASHCSGFTYHAAQPGKQHDCQILGAGFITNDGAGWVSGVR